MGLNTVICRQQAELVERQKELDQAVAEVYWARLSFRAPPYHPPLEQIRISSGTGYRADPMGGVDAKERLHRGIDLPGRVGDPVYAMLAGRVAEHWVPPDGKYWKGHPIMGGYIVLD
ncbi:unnamed protein product, partial [marine sediment metagenome]